MRAFITRMPFVMNESKGSYLQSYFIQPMAKIVPYAAHLQEKNLLDPFKNLTKTFTLLRIHTILQYSTYFYNLLGHPSCFCMTRATPESFRFFYALVPQIDLRSSSVHPIVCPFFHLDNYDAQMTLASLHLTAVVLIALHIYCELGLKHNTHTTL